MAQRAAIVTGASGGIGLAIAHMLAQEGHALTITARRPEPLEQAAQELRDAGAELTVVQGNMSDESDIQAVVSAHRDAYGRLDVLVNNAGVGIGAPIGETKTKFLDMQLDVNLRAAVIFYRECLDLLQAAGTEHRKALVVNLSSIAGKYGQAWLSIYSATKWAMLGFTQSMNKELSTQGIHSVAFCPGWVDTRMTDFVKESVSPDQMIQPSDIAEGVRFCLRTSVNCLIPEIVFARPGDAEL